MIGCLCFILLEIFTKFYFLIQRYLVYVLLIDNTLLLVLYLIYYMNGANYMNAIMIASNYCNIIVMLLMELWWRQSESVEFIIRQLLSNWRGSQDDLVIDGLCPIMHTTSYSIIITRISPLPLAIAHFILGFQCSATLF